MHWPCLLARCVANSWKVWITTKRTKTESVFLLSRWWYFTINQICLTWSSCLFIAGKIRTVGGKPVDHHCLDRFILKMHVCFCWPRVKPCCFSLDVTFKIKFASCKFQFHKKRHTSTVYHMRFCLFCDRSKYSFIIPYIYL